MLDKKIPLQHFIFNILICLMFHVIIINLLFESIDNHLVGDILTVTSYAISRPWINNQHLSRKLILTKIIDRLRKFFPLNSAIFVAKVSFVKVKYIMCVIHNVFFLAGKVAHIRKYRNNRLPGMHFFLQRKHGGQIY